MDKSSAFARGFKIVKGKSSKKRLRSGAFADAKFQVGNYTFGGYFFFQIANPRFVYYSSLSGICDFLDVEFFFAKFSREFCRLPASILDFA